MKYFELTTEEQEILNEYELGNYESVPQFDEAKVVFQKIAQATLNKTRNINIRITEADYQKLKAAAVAEGIPYQTLVTSLIHKYNKTVASN